MFRFDGCQNDEKDELAKAKDPGIGAGGGGGWLLTCYYEKKKTALKTFTVKFFTITKYI